MTETSSPSSAKQAVLDWVRSKNPQTLELKEGCILKETDQNTKLKAGVSIFPVQLWICSAKHTEVRGGVYYEYVDIIPHRSFYGSKIPGNICLRVNTGKMIEVDHKYEILGSDMTKQELEIALHSFNCTKKNETTCLYEIFIGDEPHDVEFDLTKNLHNQTDDFYESILPLIHEQ